MKSNWIKFIALAMVCLLIGVGIGLLSTKNVEKIYPKEVKFTYFDDSEKINNTDSFLIKLYEPIGKNEYGSWRIETLRNNGVRLLQPSEIPTIFHSLIEENKVEEIENLNFVECVYAYPIK